METQTGRLYSMWSTFCRRAAARTIGYNAAHTERPVVCVQGLEFVVGVAMAVVLNQIKTTASQRCEKYFTLSSKKARQQYRQEKVRQCNRNGAVSLLFL